MKPLTSILPFIKGRVDPKSKDVSCKNRRSVSKSEFSRSFFVFIFLMLFYVVLSSPLIGETMLRDRSLSGIFIVESTNQESLSKWLMLLDEMYSRAMVKMELPEISDHRLLLRVVPERSEVEGIQFRAKVAHGKLDFYLQGVDSMDRSQWLREISRFFIYSRILPANKEWNEGEILPEIPFWIVEGLAQTLDPTIFDLEVIDPIVRRMGALEKTPALQQVMSWRGLSSNALEASFQRSFCYALYRWIFRKESSSNNPWSNLGIDLKGWYNADPDEMQGRWIRYLKGFHAQKELYLSWDQSERAVERLMVFQVPMGKDSGSETQPVQWDALRGVKNSEEFKSLISQRQSELIVLETQVHFVWRSFLFDYRTALQLLANDLRPQVEKKSHYSSREVNSMTLTPPPKKVTYEDKIAQAKQELAEMKNSSQKVTEYLDWFLVNYRSNREEFKFEDYYRVANQRGNSLMRANDPYHSTGLRIESLGE